jgi:hypothetical protein
VVVKEMLCEKEEHVERQAKVPLMPLVVLVELGKEAKEKRKIEIG